MKYLSQSLIFATLVSLVAVVYAQPPLPSGRGPLPFTAFDLDGNGAISQQEFDNIHAERWQTPNPGGYSARPIDDPPRFDEFDQNGDGSLSPQELMQGQRERRAQRQPAPGQGRGMGRGMGPRGMGNMGPGRGDQMPSFSDFDLNGDGLLHQQEFEQARAQRIRERLMQGYQMRNLHNAPTFNAIDSDQDGTVSSQEFAAAQAQHRQSP
jgi:Ca2+-binding EF-hand superfamily protein